MINRNVYLSPDALIEPLFNQWHAWSYLISPATAPMYVANSHCEIMQSFISTPHLHIRALKDPAMRGGPFLHYDQSKVEQISALLEKTCKEQAHMLRFAEAVKELDRMLVNEATGLSLESVYKSVPKILGGAVELVYDLNNHPSIRFMEGLLYKGAIYNPASQSILLSRKYDRAFAFSTPRLPGNDELWFNISFNDDAIDELARMRHTPLELGHAKNLLGISDEKMNLFSSFFTERAPYTEPEYQHEHVRIRYYGHACLLIESRGVSVLCDPVIGYKDHCETPHFTFEDLPQKIDYVLITHNHQDHLMLESLLQLRHRIGAVVVPRGSGSGLADPSLKLMLQSIGFKTVTEIGEMDTIENESATITAIPFLGEHADLNITAKTGYLVKIKGRSIMIMADSNNIHPELYKQVQKCIGDVDMLFIGMECEGAPLSWLYGPLLTRPISRKIDQSRRFDGSNAVKAIDMVDKFHPEFVFVYAMGQEPWLKYLTSIEYTDQSRPIIESNKLVEECRRRGLTAERLYGSKELLLEPRL